MHLVLYMDESSYFFVPSETLNPWRLRVVFFVVGWLTDVLRGCGSLMIAGLRMAVDRMRIGARVLHRRSLVFSARDSLLMVVSPSYVAMG